MTFWEKYYAATETNESYVCLGLDSDLELIPEHLKNQDLPILEFNREIIEATKDKVAAYKLNFAFYLSAGFAGMQALKESISLIPGNIPAIIDCKTGDIANTMRNYGKAFFDEMKADAVTVNPLMGEDVFTPLLSFREKFLFILTLTSNPSASQFLKKNSLYRDIAKLINNLDCRQSGAVVGATNPQQLAELREMMPQSLFLIPGIGAQGGSIEEVMKYTPAARNDPRILINSSRGIIFKDRGTGFAAAASRETGKLRQNINRCLRT